MFYRDHNPPHFHAVYAQFETLIDIEKNEVFSGYLLPPVLGIVTKWTALHQKELMEKWERARKQESLFNIEPLV
jgi:hypothetical protein